MAGRFRRSVVMALVVAMCFTQNTGIIRAAEAPEKMEAEAAVSGKTSVVITCDPDNSPSRKTCIRLGCMFERIAEVPEDIYRKFEISHTKCRYIWHVVSTEEL